jgi:Putative TetR-family transcriptional regulator
VGCAASALAVDVAREPAGKPVRQAYVEGLRVMVDDLAQTVESDDPRVRHDEALVRMALLVGALTLARATDGDPLSDEMLNAVRSQLLGSTA